MTFPTIEQTVRYRLELYLDALDGAEPRDVHAMVTGLVEKVAIEMMLEHAGGNQSLAAEYLGLSRLTLRKKIEQHGIKEAAVDTLLLNSDNQLKYSTHLR